MEGLPISTFIRLISSAKHRQYRASPSKAKTKSSAQNFYSILVFQSPRSLSRQQSVQAPSWRLRVLPAPPLATWLPGPEDPTNTSLNFHQVVEEPGPSSPWVYINYPCGPDQVLFLSPNFGEPWQGPAPQPIPSLPQARLSSFSGTAPPPCSHFDLCDTCACLPLVAPPVRHRKWIAGLFPSPVILAGLACAQCSVSSCHHLAQEWGDLSSGAGNAGSVENSQDASLVTLATQLHLLPWAVRSLLLSPQSGQAIRINNLINIHYWIINFSLM